MCDCINSVNKSLNRFHSLTLERNYRKQTAAEQEIVCVSTLYENSGRSDCLIKEVLVTDNLSSRSN